MNNILLGCKKFNDVGGFFETDVRRDNAKSLCLLKYWATHVLHRKLQIKNKKKFKKKIFIVRIYF